MQITRLSAESAEGRLTELIALLTDAVDSGASIGFIPRLKREDAEAFWDDVIATLRTPYRILLVAIDEGKIAGSIQLDYARKPNATHRAEVIKLVVLTSARNQGIGRALMEEAARVAKADGRTLLYLDTKSGDPAQRLYESLGYTKVGEIPRYVFDEAGEFHATMIMYKHLV